MRAQLNNILKRLFGTYYHFTVSVPEKGKPRMIANGQVVKATGTVWVPLTFSKGFLCSYLIDAVKKEGILSSCDLHVSTLNKI